MGRAFVSKRFGAPRAAHRSGSDPSNEDLCAYIAEICAELRDLAQRPQFRTINYLLDMARLEAERMGKEIRTSNNEAKQSGEPH